MNAPSLLTLFVARASAPSNRSNTPPKTTRRPATIHACGARRDGGDAGDQEADHGQRVGRQAEPAEADGDRRHRGRGPGPGSPGRRASRSRGGLPRAASARRGRAPAPGALANDVERLGDDRVDGLAALPARRHEPDLAQLAEVPRHERLRQPDVVDQLASRSPGRRPGGGRCAAGWRRPGPCGRGAARAGRRGCRRRRRSCCGFGRARGTRVIGDLRRRVVDAVGSTAVHINGD